jgi:hypothetical protein
MIVTNSFISPFPALKIYKLMNTLVKFRVSFYRKNTEYCGREQEVKGEVWGKKVVRKCIIIP